MIPYKYFILYEGADYCIDYFVEVMKELKRDTPIVMIRVDDGLISDKREHVAGLIIRNGLSHDIILYTDVDIKDRMELYEHALCNVMSPLPYLYFKNSFVPITKYKPVELASIIKEEFYGLLRVTP